MKYIIVAVLALFLTGCYEKTIQSEVNENAVTTSQDKIDTNLKNNIIEAAVGCSAAKVIINHTNKKFLFFGDSLAPDYNCSGKEGTEGRDNTNPIPSIVGEANSNIRTVVGLFVTTGMAYLIYLIFFQKNLALAASSKVRTQNFAIKKLHAMFEYVVAVGLGSLLFWTVFSVSENWATTYQRIEATNALTKEISVKFPDFSFKNNRLGNVLDYQICVKSNSFSEKDQDPSIKILKTAGGRSISASFGRCKLVGAYLIDNKGVTIAKEYGLFDYTAMQDKALADALAKFVKSADLIAANYSKSLLPFGISSKFNESTASCGVESLAGVDTRFFSSIELEKYKAYALNCISREFVYDLTKAKNMTMDSIDTQQAQLQHRNAFICSAGYEQKGMMLSEDTEKFYKQCIQDNCNSLTSPYACSTALNSYFVMKDDEFRQFLTLPVSDKRRRIVDNTSAQKIVNTFNADFNILEQREFYQSGGTVLATFPVSVVQGELQIKEIESTFTIGHKNVVNGMNGFGFDSVLGRFTGRDGFAGSKKFVVCMQHPNVMHDGFDCGNIYNEMYAYGLKMSIVGTQLKVATAINKAGGKVSVKGKGATELSDQVEYTMMKKVVGMFAKAAQSRKLIAWAVPVLTDAGGGVIALAANDDGFADSFYEKTGNYTEFYTMMLFSQLNDGAATIVSNAANAMTAAGQFFMYLLPLSDYFIFFAIITGMITNIMFDSVTIMLRWFVNLDAEPERRDLDRTAIIIICEKLLLACLNATFAFTMIPHIFSQTMIHVVGDLNKFSSALFGWEDGIKATVICLLISVLVFVVFYKVTSSLMSRVSGHLEHFMHGNVSRQDMRVQGIQEAKVVAKAYKGRVAA
ncbi:hypothetical protein [Pseudomonas fluorescens]|uniref:hypothetical protein n=1 Tax=Pseudomonas fluorescens TaxID=294 RepID=UPI00058A7940|nr:hypothetical protein [Pseudomonas fluorescens]CEL31215.1 hypothetical protein SRM1_04579 [Pseudomonas fluorescens]